MKLKTTLFGNVYQFKDVKEVLAKANELRSGDVLAGVAAASSQERVAAKQVLSEMTVADIRNNPVIAYEDDCVTRLIQDDVNETAYNQIKNWSISELREYVLNDETSVDDIAFTRKGLTSEVVAAVAKICSNADLIYGAKKMPVIKKANTTIGIPGTFSARLQPNDTRDDVQSIAAQIYEGLSFGVGDAVIGVNPVTDDVENLSRVLDTIYGVIDKFNIPTQGCVLAHVTTQIEAIRRGAPGGLIFQSICGSEKGLKEFGVELAMLDEARAVGAEFNRIAGENCLYFETGQGSALYAGAAHGPSPTAGEVLIMLGGPNPAEVRAGLDAMVANIENGAAFQWANDAENTAFLAHVVSRTGSYLSSTAGITLGDPMAYLVAPPLEATYGIDAALKSADVQLVTYVPPPSETNYSAAFLTGSQAACKAACNAFTDAVLEIARNPIQRA